MQVVNSNSNDLLSQLQRHDQAFCSLMELVPAELYFPQEPDEIAWTSKYAKNKKAAAPKQQVKETSRKGKRAKFDPAQQNTNAEIQREKSSQAATGAGEAEQDAKPSDENPTTAEASIETSNTSPAADVPPTSKGGSAIDDLRRRLHARIEELRSKRKAEATNTQRPAKKSKPSPKTSSAGSVAADNKGTSQNPGRSPSQPTSQAVSVPTTSTDSIGVDHPAIDYGSLLVADDSLSADGKVRGKNKTKGKGIVGLKTLLQKAEAKKRRLEELKNSNKGKAAADSRSWGAALQMAQGEKVRDDPKLLKKTLQRKLKQKQKSTKEWKKRTQTVQKEKLQRQRDKVARMRGNRKKQATTAPKAPRPGFEGKKGSQFLNKAE